MCKICIYPTVTSLNLNSNATQQKGVTCLNINLHTQATKYNWDLAPCSPSHLSTHKIGEGRWKYIEKCCLPNGNYLLECKSSELHGWIDSFVTIGKHQFCDDSTSYNSMVKLNIPGEHSCIMLSMCFILFQP